MELILKFKGSTPTIMKLQKTFENFRYGKKIIKYYQIILKIIVPRQF